MVKEKTPNQVFEELSKKGEYEEAHTDKDEISSIWKMALEDYEYGKSLRKAKGQNWRVIFNVHYDVIRELCGLLMRFNRQKTSNHQGLFAFISVMGLIPRSSAPDDIKGELLDTT